MANRKAGAPGRKAGARDWAVFAALLAMVLVLFAMRLRLSPLAPTTIWQLSGSDGTLSLSCRTLRGTMILESDAGRVSLDGLQLRIELPAFAGRRPANVVLGRRAEVRVVGQVVIGGRTFHDGDGFTATADNVLARESPTRSALRSFKRRIELLLRRRQPIEGMIRCSAIRPKEPSAPGRELGDFIFRERQAGANDSLSAVAWRTVTRTMTTAELWTMVANSPLPSGFSTQAPLERFRGMPLTMQSAGALRTARTDAESEAALGATVMTPERARLIDAIRLMETQADTPGYRTPTGSLATLDGESLSDAACRTCRDMLCRTVTDGSRCIDAPGASTTSLGR